MSVVGWEKMQKKGRKESRKVTIALSVPSVWCVCLKEAQYINHNHMLFSFCSRKGVVHMMESIAKSLHSSTGICNLNLISNVT